MSSNVVDSSIMKPSVHEVDDIVAKDIVEDANEEELQSSPPTKKSKTASYFNVMFSGFALLSDGYQSGVISFINLLLTTIYGSEIFNSTMSSRLSYSLFVGAIIGQIGK